MNLVDARLNRGLSRREAAAKLDMSPGVLARLEAGERVHPAHAKKIADFYGVRVTDIWPAESAQVPA